jgi:hypothetical protein
MAATQQRDVARPFAGPFNALLVYGAPVAAIAAGIAAEWLDFRALRYPLLAMVGAGVLASSIAVTKRDGSGRAFVTTILLGIATWGMAETLYVALHTTRGEAFEAERFGPQWAQALGLIGVHALFLGAPTGLTAAIVRHLLVRPGG